MLSEVLVAKTFTCPTVNFDCGPQNMSHKCLFRNGRKCSHLVKIALFAVRKGYPLWCDINTFIFPRCIMCLKEHNFCYNAFATIHNNATYFIRDVDISKRKLQILIASMDTNAITRKRVSISNVLP